METLLKQIDIIIKRKHLINELIKTIEKPQIDIKLLDPEFIIIAIPKSKIDS